MNSSSPTDESAQLAEEILDSAATTPAPPEPLGMAAVLKIPMLRRLWYARIISVFGDFLALFAVIGILTFKLNATAQQITGVQISYMLPIAVLGIMAGVFVDRWPTKPTMVSRLHPRRPLPAAHLRHPDLALLRHPRRHLSRLQLLLARPGSGHPLGSSPARPPLRQRPHATGHVRHAHHRPRHRLLMVAAFGAKSCYILDSASFIGSALLIGSSSSSNARPNPPYRKPAKRQL